MRAILTPQFNPDSPSVNYSASGDVLTVTIGEVTESFDFTNFPDGETYEITPQTLPFNPIVHAQKNNGVLTVTLIDYMGEKPERESDEIGVDDDGFPLLDMESEQSYQTRVTEWQQRLKKRVVEI